MNLEAQREAARAARAELKKSAQKGGLVAAARRCLGRDGIVGLTIDAVAREANVSKPSVHYYFATKEALAAAVIVEVGLEELAMFEAAIEGATRFRDAADACLRAFADRYRDDFESFRVHYVWSQVFRVRDPALEALPQRAGPLLMRLEALVRGDQARGELSLAHDPRALVNVVAALCTGIFTRLTLLEANAARSMVGIDDVVNEARTLVAHALHPPSPRARR